MSGKAASGATREYGQHKDGNQAFLEDEGCVVVFHASVSFNFDSLMVAIALWVPASVRMVLSTTLVGVRYVFCGVSRRGILVRRDNPPSALP